MRLPQQPAVGAVARAVAVLEAARAMARDDALGARPRAADVVGMDEVLDAATDELLGRPAERAAPGRRRALDAAVVADDERQALDHRLLAPVLEVRHEDVGQHLKLFDQEVAGLVRLGVEHGDGADREPARRQQGHRGVEADARLAEHPRVGAPALVELGVLDDQRRARLDDRAAERVTALDVVQARARLRLDPLAPAVYERRDGDRHERHARREAGDGVELGIGRRADDPVAGERLQALALTARGRVIGNAIGAVRIDGSAPDEAPNSGSLYLHPRHVP